MVNEIVLVPLGIIILIILTPCILNRVVNRPTEDIIIAEIVEQCEDGDVTVPIVYTI